MLAGPPMEGAGVSKNTDVCLTNVTMCGGRFEDLEADARVGAASMRFIWQGKQELAWSGLGNSAGGEAQEAHWWVGGCEETCVWESSGEKIGNKKTHTGNWQRVADWRCVNITSRLYQPQIQQTLWVVSLISSHNLLTPLWADGPWYSEDNLPATNRLLTQ